MLKFIIKRGQINNMEYATEKTALSLLDELSIQYERIEHSAVWHMDDENSPKDLPKVKNLFLKLKKSNQFYLYLTTEKPVDFKSLATQLEVSRSKLTFADEDELENVLHVVSGIVTPLALPYDKNHLVTVLLDHSLQTLPSVSAHPNVNNATLIFSYSDLQKILNSLGYTPLIIE